MSGMKRFAEEVMVEMGKEELDDEVLAEAQRRLDASLSSSLRKGSPRLNVVEVSVSQCIKDGTHLTDCDDDGYCNYCGEQ